MCTDVLQKAFILTFLLLYRFLLVHADELNVRSAKSVQVCVSQIANDQKKKKKQTKEQRAKETLNILDAFILCFVKSGLFFKAYLCWL